MPPREISLEGRQVEAVIDRLEKKQKAEPDQAEQIRGGARWDEQRHEEHRGAEHDERRLRCAAKTQRARFLFEPAERFDERGSHENSRRDRCERPAVADPSFDLRLRQADVGPVRETQIVRFKNQPQRNRKRRHLQQAARLLAQPRMAGDRKHRGIGNQNVRSPRHRAEIRRRRFDAVKHQVLRANQRDEAEPAVRGKWPAARAEKFHDENRSRSRRSV